MTLKPSAALHWAFIAPLLALPPSALSQESGGPEPFYEDTSDRHVGASFRAYQAGVGHTDASAQHRRPLDGSLRPAPPEAPDTSLPVVDWSGTYFGASLGGLLSSTDLDGAIDSTIESDSYVLSGHAGRNYQIGSVVFGAELDASTTDINDQTATLGGTTTHSGIDWLASARLRAGVAIDNFLFYGTGGVALTTSDVEIKALGFSAESKELHTGYVIGGGAEMAIVDGVSARVEALHYGFSGETLTTPSGSSSLDLDVTTVRAGLSLRFK